MDIKINNKFVAYKGFIGRRDYILNLMYLLMITAILSAPFSIWTAKAINNPLAAFNILELLKGAPVFASFFWGVACVIAVVIGYGLYARRIADIRGEEGIPAFVWAGVLVAAPYLWVLKTNPLTALIFIICLIAGFIIMALPGKISGQIPHDPVKRFNWGAFWGTWIWGLFNKTYITLWMLLLWFTPAGFAWAVICGIKGNEWAFKNKGFGTENIEEFQKGQRNQAIFWNVFAGFVMFVMPVLIAFLIVAFLVAGAIKNPEGSQKIMDKAESIIEYVVEDSFESYDIGADENRFYMNPKDWTELSYNERYNVLKGAATLASMKKRQADENYKGTYSSEIFKTRIYSAYNDELLAEFKMDEKQALKDFKSAFKAVMNGMYFNTNPELPPPLP